MNFLWYWKSDKIAIRNNLDEDTRGGLEKSIVIPIIWIAIKQLALDKLFYMTVT